MFCYVNCLYNWTIRCFFSLVSAKAVPIRRSISLVSPQTSCKFAVYTIISSELRIEAFHLVVKWYGWVLQADPNADVRGRMVNAGIVVIDKHGKENVSLLFPIFENYLNKKVCTAWELFWFFCSTGKPPNCVSFCNHMLLFVAQYIRIVQFVIFC